MFFHHLCFRLVQMDRTVIMINNNKALEQKYECSEKFDRIITLAASQTEEIIAPNA